jgi:release factor glutamine methyltransferase
VRASEAVRWAADQLQGEGARLDAELLVAKVLGCSRHEFLLSLGDEAVEMSRLAPLLERRRQGEPLAYILGHREFWSLDFRVTPAVLIPRPDSETVVEQAVRYGRNHRMPRVLDLGTGSGCLLLSVLSELTGAWGVGLDRSPEAISVASWNARALGLDHRSAFVVADWTAPLAGSFDIVLSNPPYIGDQEALSVEVAGYEPAAALFAGDDGLDAYRRIVPALSTLLARGGAAHLEIGYSQADVVSELARRCGFDVSLARDLGGRPRCLTLAYRAGEPRTSCGD